MIDACRLAARAPRAPQDAATGADGGSADAPDVDAAAQARIAAQRKVFDEQAAEQAEREREREALESMLMAQLKYEDEIMKKWIEMI
jgi:hypothetical protein